MIIQLTFYKNLIFFIEFKLKIVNFCFLIIMFQSHGKPTLNSNITSIFLANLYDLVFANNFSFAS